MIKTTNSVRANTHAKAGIEISNIGVKIKNNNKTILKNVNLKIKKGEIHVLMGRNGSGKSTLSKAIVGHPSYEITKGQIMYKGMNLNELEVSERALKGIFLCFQSPVEIQGVKNLDFLRKISNSRRTYLGKSTYDPLEFYIFINNKIESVGLNSGFLSRNINEGFSGGEKKRNELLQLIAMEAEFCIFDEIDSGLDIDSIKSLVKIIGDLKSQGVGILIITHYKKLLDLLNPDFVHILKNGEIIRTGNKDLADLIEKEGFEIFS
uniref:Putative chloroplast protein Ycf16 n=1 Tax=Amorphochlora amoebiformis TaxID=1561963 RepID=A0A0H5BKT3_9EUKA|nr:putative chloroplast protein Ycf16 [Amorphochlora amoebiformis]|mmetsp:Transcript_30304/g.48577  ORF Transcript_30304/g.48577 Transcript_30304/m.48577 type:complete len:264 (+) Transcript_30304:3-794(+)